MLKKILFTNIFLFIWISPIIAQDYWQKLTSPSGGNISSIIIDVDNFMFTSTSVGGIFRSSNNGANWTQINNGLSHFRMLSLATGGGYIFAGAASGGVYRSSDKGDNWTQVISGLTNLRINSLVFNNNFIFAGTDGGVFRSSDNGDTWKPVNVGLTNLNCNALTAGSNYLFTGTDNGAFRSSDNGDNWTQINNGLSGNVIVALTLSANTIYSGTDGFGVYRSTNEGDNWTQVNNGIANLNILSLTISSGYVYAGSEGGIFRSSNSGNVWIQVNNGLTNLFCNSLAVSSTNVFAGTNSGVFQSSDTEDTWTPINDGIFAVNFLALEVNENFIYAGANGGIYHSTDNGISWAEINIGLSGSIVYSLTNNGSYIFAGTNNGVYRSNINENTWTQVNNGLFNLFGNALTNSGNNIFVGTNSGVFRSTNDGNTWTAIQNGLTGSVIELAADSNYIYAGTNGSGVFRSSVDGNDWIQVNNGITNLRVRTLTISNNYVFGGTNTGLYRSSNDGDNWTEANNGLSSLLVNGLDTGIDYVYAGTDGGGVHRSSNNGDSWTEINSGMNTLKITTVKMSSNGYFYAVTFDPSITNGNGIYKSNNPVNKSISVLSPIAGVNWQAASKQTVTWTSINVTENVNIRLSTNGGNTFPVTLKSNTPNDGNEVIDVPDNPSATCVLKVESVLDNNVFGLSTGTFTISPAPEITVTSPSASENWIAGTQQPVTWTSVNVTGNVNIKLSTNGGNTFPISLRSNISNDGNETVEVPDNPSTTCVVKVESADDNNIFGISTGNFTISPPPSIIVTAPAASENWIVGTQQSVTWTSVSISGNVNIKLSTNGGSTFPVTLKSNTSNDGNEVIDVPDNPSTTCVVKVESVTDNNVFGLSPGNFSIVLPAIAVIEPAALSNWTVGSQQTVTWTSENVTGNVNIKLSTDDGNTFPILLKSDTENDNSEIITVPNNPSSTCAVKVESVSDNDIFGLSESFTIALVPTITVIAPAASANWTIGSQQSVTWTSTNVSGNVNIKLSTDGGNTFPVLLKSDIQNDSSEIIEVPDNPSTTCVVKVEAVNDNNIFGLSTGNFTITSAPTITVTLPEASVNWIIGTQQVVSWASVNVTGNVNIKLSTDGGITFPVSLKSNISNDGSDTIDVPDNQSDTCRIKVESVNDNNIFGLNPGNFIIAPAPKISVTSPAGLSNWIVGSQQTVTWTSVNVPGNVNIKLSINGGNTFPVTLKSNTSNDGTEVIDVPDNPSLTCVVKVEAVVDNNIFGLSEGNLVIILPAIIVTTPPASASWTVGSKQTITWTSVSVAGNVNIKLSTDGGNNFPVNLKTNIPNDGIDTIDVPDIQSVTCRIKVESADDNNIFGLNPGDFIITSEPTINVTSPVLSEKWTIGSQQTVLWSSTNVTGNVNIKLSTDGGTTFPISLKSNTTNDGDEIIEVPDNQSNTCRIKVESADDNNIFGLNPGDFVITTEPTINVTSPAAAVKWNVGSQQTVSWTSANVTGNVNIKLSTDGGTTFPVLLKSDTPNDGSDTIDVPDNQSGTCRIKVESENDNNIFGLNPGDFIITTEPTINVTSPAASVKWNVGSQQTVSWTSANITGNVNIKLSTDGGTTFPVLLKSNTPNDGSDTIDVPDNQSSTCRIKVELENDNNTFGLNPGDFIITLESSILVTAPVGSTYWTVGSKQTVTWTSVNVTGEINIKLSTDGGSTFPVSLKSGITNDNSEIIDVPNSPSNNCRVRVESVIDNNIHDMNDNNFSIVSYPAMITVNSNKTFSDINDVKNYRMIGLPGNGSIPVNMNGEFEYDWQVYWDNGNAQNYLVGSADFKFTPGKAYWILSKNPFTINQEVNAVGLNTVTNSYSIPLHQGWNLISNPFDKSVSWANIRAINGLGENQKIYSWNGTWDSLKTQMVPYEGYYFNNISGKDSLTIPYNPGGALGKITINEEYPKNINEFLRVSINAKNQSEKSEVFIGFDQAAKNDYDEKDYFTPPGDFQKVGISLLRKEMPERVNHFFIEQRPSIGEGQEYDLEIKTEPGKALKIVISAIEFFDKFNIYLSDERLKNFYNIKEKKSIELNLAHQYNPFKLFIGTDEFIENIKQNNTPLSYQLFQNYPNPFNPKTTIRFSLPELDRVNITVYNILGEIVNTLVNNEIYEAGNYEVKLDGTYLSSGIYLVGMHTQKFKMQRKMILIK